MFNPYKNFQLIQKFDSKKGHIQLVYMSLKSWLWWAMPTLQ